MFKTCKTVQVKHCFILLFSLAAITGLSILIYINSLESGWHFDDHILLERVDWKKIKFSFLSKSGGLGLGYASPIAGISYYLNYIISGLNPRWYHITNLAIHIISGLFIYRLVLTMYNSPLFDNKSRPDKNFLALFSALTFVSHPIATQSVTYIYQRTTSLAVMFGLIGIVFFMEAKNHYKGYFINLKHLLFYILSFLAILTAILTKHLGLTVPFILLLCEYFFYDRFFYKKIAKIKYLMPFIFIGTARICFYLILTDIGNSDLSPSISNSGILSNQIVISRWEYLTTQINVVVTYIRLLLLPVNQNLDYDYPVYSLFQIETAFSFLIIILTLFFSIRSKYKIISFAVLWSFIGISVTSSIIPQIDVIFEHRIYPALPGFSLVLVFGVYYILNAFLNRNTKTGRKFFITIMIVIISIFSILTFYRNEVWRNEFTLWSDTVKKSPNKPRPHHNLALEYWKQGLKDRALAEFQKTLTLNPNAYYSHFAMANIYFEKNLTQLAEKKLGKVISINPNFSAAYIMLGNIYEKKGKIDKAIQYYNLGLAKKPEQTKSYSLLAALLLKKGELKQAIRALKKAVEYDPEYAIGYNNLASVYLKKGLYAEALKNFKRALGIDPENKSIINNIKYVNSILSKPDFTTEQE